MKTQLTERSERKLSSEFDPALLARKNMYYVYVLQSIKDHSIYVGTTNDLERRCNEHNKGDIEATRRFVPLRLVYYEAYSNETDARDREYKLKHHGSVIGHLKKRLKNSLSQSLSQKSGVQFAPSLKRF